MAKVWTSERDQRLFLLFIEQVKVDAPALVASWKTNYGKSTQPPQIVTPY